MARRGGPGGYYTPLNIDTPSEFVAAPVALEGLEGVIGGALTGLAGGLTARSQKQKREQTSKRTGALAMAFYQAMVAEGIKPETAKLGMVSLMAKGDTALLQVLQDTKAAAAQLRKTEAETFGELAGGLKTEAETGQIQAETAEIPGTAAVERDLTRAQTGAIIPAADQLSLEQQRILGDLLGKSVTAEGAVGAAKATAAGKAVGRGGLTGNQRTQFVGGLFDKLTKERQAYDAALVKFGGDSSEVTLPKPPEDIMAAIKEMATQRLDAVESIFGDDIAKERGEGEPAPTEAGGGAGPAGITPTPDVDPNVDPNEGFDPEMTKTAIAEMKERLQEHQRRMSSNLNLQFPDRGKVVEAFQLKYPKADFESVMAIYDSLAVGR